MDCIQAESLENYTFGTFWGFDGSVGGFGGFTGKISPVSTSLVLLGVQKVWKTGIKIWMALDKIGFTRKGGFGDGFMDGLG